MESLLDIFNNYGWIGLLGVFLAMILFIGIKYLNNKLSSTMTTGLEKVGEKLTDQMSKQNDKMMDCIVEQQKQLVTYLIDEKKNELDRHNNMITDKEDLAVDVNDYLKIL